jgi:GTPase
LTGGIGGRGPGETKLEVDRRRVRDRIHLLEKELEKLVIEREQRRARRSKSGIPVFSIVGYTNAGKSTLFNILTHSEFNAENKLFATLDTATRKLRYGIQFSNERITREAVVTDTVGLIKDLPRDLMGAFRPTFDELQESSLLIHLIDMGDSQFPGQIEAVEEILTELNLDHIARLRVFNKEDKVGPEEARNICQRYDAISISALNPNTLERLFWAIEAKLREVHFSEGFPAEICSSMKTVEFRN